MTSEKQADQERHVSFNTMHYMVLLFSFWLAVGCSPVPSKYLREAEPGVTYTRLVAASQPYRGKVVIMGGTIMEEEMRDGRLWLYVRNRPLDRDYEPQLPPSPEDPEAGAYWVIVESGMTFPDSHRQWSDILVVGRVTALAAGKEPILTMVYMRGRKLRSRRDKAWEDFVEATIVPLTPAGAVGEMGQ